MADMPIGAPKLPIFDPTSIIQGIGTKVQMNIPQIVVIIGIGAIIVGYLLYLIWCEYKKNPIRHKPQKRGKGMKLSDILRKK